MKKAANLGAVLPLFAMLIFVIFAFLALAIDTALFSAAKNQHQNASDFAVLAALNTYSQQVRSNVPSTQALNDARAVAESVLEDNRGRSVGRFLSGDQGEEIRIGTANEEQENGSLIHGCWFQTDPGCGTAEPARECGTGAYPPGDPCPCPGGTWRGSPCFRALEPTSDAEGSAMELRYRSGKTTPLRALFGRVISGSNAITLYSESKATLVPRNLVFLPDITNTLTFESHQRVRRPADCALARSQGRTPGRFSYQTLPGPDRCPDNLNVFPADFTRLTDDGEPDPSSPTPNEVLNHTDCGTRRWDAAYRCRTFSYRDGSETDFWIDEAIPPQPLTSVVDGIWQVMDDFYKRRVPGDGVAVIGFDNELLPERSLVSGSGLDARPAAPGSDEYTSFMADIARGLPFFVSNGPCRFRRLLFPRALDRNSPAKPTMSDLPAALLRAQQVLQRAPNFDRAQNSVIVFSDGMSTCFDTGAGTRTCANNNVQFFNRSLVEVRKILVGSGASPAEPHTYLYSGIGFNMFLFGDHVRPHTRAFRNRESTGCMTQENAEAEPDDRHRYVSYTEDERWVSRERLYLAPNQLYDYVKQLGGVWAPIRPVLRDTAGNPNNFSDDLEQLCKELDFHDPKWAGVRTPGGLELFDDQGRVRFDPLGRSAEQQVSDYLTQRILRTPPFILVQE